MLLRAATRLWRHLLGRHCAAAARIKRASPRCHARRSRPASCQQYPRDRAATWILSCREPCLPSVGKCAANGSRAHASLPLLGCLAGLWPHGGPNWALACNTFPARKGISEGRGCSVSLARRALTAKRESTIQHSSDSLRVLVAFSHEPCRRDAQSGRRPSGSQAKRCTSRTGAASPRPHRHTLGTPCTSLPPYRRATRSPNSPAANAGRRAATSADQ